MNNLINLTKNRFTNLPFYKFRIYIFVGVFLLVTIFDLSSIAALRSSSAEILATINVFMVLNAIFILFLGLFLSTSVFRWEISNNVVSLELREGYSKKDIFISRLVEVISEIAIFLFLTVIINLIAIGSANEFHSVYWYKMFMISLGWYSVIMFISTALGIFFSTFSIMSVARTCAGIILLVVTLLGLFGGINSVGRNKESSINNSSALVEKIRNSYVLDFAKNQLEINSADEWKDIKNEYHTENIDHNNSWLGALQERTADDNVYLEFGNKFLNPSTPSSKFEKFFNFEKDLDSYFYNTKMNIDFNSINNWATLQKGGDDIDGAEQSTEPLNKIIEKMNKSSLAKKYSIIEYLKDFSDSTVLYNLDYYPLWQSSVVYGNGEPRPSMSVDLQQCIEKSGVPASEIIFNKYLVFCIDNAFGESNDLSDSSNNDVPSEMFKNEAKKTSISMIYNPLIQFTEMLNGVDYNNILLNDVANSASTGLGHTRSTIIQSSMKSLINPNVSVESYERLAHVEPIYVCYVVANSLLVFASYFIYRKNIVQ